MDTVSAVGKKKKWWKPNVNIPLPGSGRNTPDSGIDSDKASLNTFTPAFLDREALNPSALGKPGHLSAMTEHTVESIYSPAASVDTFGKRLNDNSTKGHQPNDSVVSGLSLYRGSAINALLREPSTKKN
ncbi:hypothetical protein BT69DRAFT_1277247 [Atractiella rhizophila]|nr:hypothetical protein BT69DRAFT_1277247 [Atractiella rhizophila]